MDVERVERFAATKLVDVTSKTFGIVVTDRADHKREWVSNLICRNHKVPVKVTREFHTLFDEQSSVDIRLMENLELRRRGERERQYADRPRGTVTAAADARILRSR